MLQTPLIANQIAQIQTLKSLMLPSPNNGTAMLGITQFHVEIGTLSRCHTTPGTLSPTRALTSRLGSTFFG